jgi:hypothetical protein
MDKKLKNGISIGVILLICISGGILFVSDYYKGHPTQVRNEQDVIPATFINQTILVQNNSVKFQNSMDYYLSIEAYVPETPQTIPVYKGTLSDDDLNRQLKYLSFNSEVEKNSTPSKSDAAMLAEKALEKYGGLPQDAVLSNIFIRERITQKSSGEITKRKPIATQVGFSRQINGMPVVGERDYIGVALGENGELLELWKRWRTLETTGESVQVITPDIAVEKLKRGETYTKLQSPSNVRIDEVRLGYYEKPGKIPEIILEPVWIFKNTHDPVYEFPVYARQFASFTMKPVVASKTINGKTVAEIDSFTLIFTDTSDASPTKWLWNFGDGTTSTEQNPAHTYKASGTYNITLTVWNDLGSDTITEQYAVGNSIPLQ